MLGPAIVFSLLTLAPSADKPGRLDVEPEDLRPGLVAEYRSIVDAKVTVARIEAKPAFLLGRSSPHPRIPAGPFEVTWTGLISLRDPGPITFSAFVGGEVAVSIDGVVVFDSRGATETSRVIAKQALSREPGYYRISIRYRSLADVPARLQLWWEGPSFARETLPAWRLGHIVSELAPAAQQEQLASMGRVDVGKFGCARCHAASFPSVDDPPRGPSLADAQQRLGRDWILNWLAEPSNVRADAHMPALFAADRAGFVERWLVADELAGHKESRRTEEKPRGDHRAGRLAFIGLGCAACHFVPDIERSAQADLNRTSLSGLGDRFSSNELAVFLGNPHGRYPDGRMPRQPVAPDQARNMAAYLLLWSKPTTLPTAESPTAAEIQQTVQRLGVRDARTAATNLIKDKGCAACHPGLGDARPQNVTIKSTDSGCLGVKAGPRFAMSADVRKALAAYAVVANREVHPSPFASRQNRLARAGCVQCHQRDSDRPPPIEEVGSKLGGGFLQEVPFQRTPRLTNLHQKYTVSHLLTTLREGTPSLRGSGYTYRMPAFGADAELLVQALAEADGELIADVETPSAADPTIGTLHGSRLTGFQGYACVSCHIWNGQRLGSPDPSNTGPDLTRTAGRIRRDWFDRYVESPLRYSPGTPMPSIFAHGKPATIPSVLDGNAAKQKEALWAYLALGKSAPSPKPPPPFPIAAPTVGEPPIVAQIPIRVADGKAIESLCLLYASHDLLIYDLADGSPHSIWTGGQILRTVQGRIRQFIAAGSATSLAATPSIRLVVFGNSETPSERTLLGYDHLSDGARVRWRLRFKVATVDVEDTLRIEEKTRRLARELQFSGIPQGVSIEMSYRDISLGKDIGIALKPTRDGKATTMISFDLPSARTPPIWDVKSLELTENVEGSLVRPGYRAIAYPRPKTIAGEDRIMPAAVAVRPRDGQVFVASMKTGELFALRDPHGNGNEARFENYGQGLFQDALSMLAEDDGLYVLHRRNLTKIVESSQAGAADRFDRVALLNQGIADSYDMGYGLARDRAGRFIFGHAPYGDGKMLGAGNVVRLTPGKPPEEIAFGMRNPLGWCAGPDGEVFFTDNQGDWVASNKLCHIVEGRYYGWPNNSQKQHHSKPAGNTTIWVPYTWAQSINGVAYDHTMGKFGPFAGQFFLAELMFGGAIIRANVEKVNGVYQGACFPFWGKGLMGPVSLAFDRRGPLYVGGITEPGWMAQPDRGALFRIDYTGQVPFEMQSIHVRQQGFQIVFTAPVDKALAGNPASYRLEHYRYEYTGAYGSPELDRTAVKVDWVDVAADGLTATLTTQPLVKDRVYMIGAVGVKSARGEPLVHSNGAYTLNEVPAERK